MRGREEGSRGSDAGPRDPEARREKKGRENKKWSVATGGEVDSWWGEGERKRGQAGRREACKEGEEAAPGAMQNRYARHPTCPAWCHTPLVTHRPPCNAPPHTHA